MPDSLNEGRIMTFSKVSSSGKDIATKVRVDSERRIGGGIFGEAYESHVTVGNHQRTFVIKRFISSTSFSLTPEENAVAAIQNYEAAKKAGLKVFPTYRLGEDKKSILMTSGNTQDSVCIGTSANSPKVEDVLGARIEQIADDDLHFLVDGVFSQAIQAGKHNISLPADAFFFFVDKATKAKVDFVIGDLDGLSIGVYGTTARTKSVNLRNAKDIVNHFLDLNVINPEEYQKIVEKSYENVLYQQGLR